MQPRSSRPQFLPRRSRVKARWAPPEMADVVTPNPGPIRGVRFGSETERRRVSGPAPTVDTAVPQFPTPPPVVSQVLRNELLLDGNAAQNHAGSCHVVRTPSRRELEPGPAAPTLTRSGRGRLPPGAGPRWRFARGMA